MLTSRKLLVDTRPLRINSFRRLWLSTLLTSVGSTFTAVAVPLQIYDTTGSSAYVGLAGLAALGPLTVAALWGGAVADAVDRRRMLLATNGGIALTSVLMCLQTVCHLRSVTALFVLVGLQQGFFGANSAARGSTTPRLVRADLLPAANALESTVTWLGSVTGPFLAGMLLPAVGVGPLYLLDAIALCATLWSVWRLPSLPATGGRAHRRAGVRQIVDGFAYLATHSRTWPPKGCCWSRSSRTSSRCSSGCRQRSSPRSHSTRWGARREGASPWGP